MKKEEHIMGKIEPAIPFPNSRFVHQQTLKRGRAIRSDQIAGQEIQETVGEIRLDDPRLSCRDVSVFYGDKQALRGINLDIGRHEVFAMIGPSGCGKSTFLRCFNRMNDTISNCRVTGTIMMDGRDINHNETDPVSLRVRVGMVFQKPNPFPKSIWENVAFGPRIHHLAKTKEGLHEIVVKSLQQAGLWDEVKDRLHQAGLGLSGGQQQRLCIARTIAIHPEVILMDEPCSALDPIATGKIEELINTLRKDYTICIVTHSMQQASRISDRTAYFHLGNLVEVGETKKIFINPLHPLTEDYITGRLG